MSIILLAISERGNTVVLGEGIATDIISEDMTISLVEEDPLTRIVVELGTFLVTEVSQKLVGFRTGPYAVWRAANGATLIELFGSPLDDAGRAYIAFCDSHQYPDLPPIDSPVVE